ncbi:MAG TPA: tetratricopeptide repeat protein, partial [Kofleriaceae bacterium]
GAAPADAPPIAHALADAGAGTSMRDAHDESAAPLDAERTVAAMRDAAPPDVETTAAKLDAAAIQDQIRQLNEAGKAALFADNYVEALSLFQRAYEIEPNARTLLNIGVAETQLGRCRDARRTLQRIIVVWPDEPPAKKAQELLDRLGPCP